MVSLLHFLKLIQYGPLPLMFLHSMVRVCGNLSLDSYLGSQYT